MSRLALLVALPLAACASAPPEEPAPPMPTMEEVMAMLEEMAAPGPEHAFLGALVGTFDAETRMWMAPDAPPEESAGTIEYSWMLDGRYLRGDYEGEFGGMAFRGVSLMGYDNAQAQYNATWFDNMSTGILPVATGQRSGNTIRFERKMFDPVQGKWVQEREVFTIESPDRHVFEMFNTMPDGEFKGLEIVYTRRK